MWGWRALGEWCLGVGGVDGLWAAVATGLFPEPKETVVAQLCDREIAAAVGISPNSVETYHGRVGTFDSVHFGGSSARSGEGEGEV